MKCSRKYYGAHVSMTKQCGDFYRLIFSTSITRYKRILNSPWIFSDLIGGKFCQLPRVYLAAFQIPERLEKSCDTVTMVPILILEFVNFGSKAGVILSITSWAPWLPPNLIDNFPPVLSLTLFGAQPRRPSVKLGKIIQPFARQKG